MLNKIKNELCNLPERLKELVKNNRRVSFFTCFITLFLIECYIFVHLYRFFEGIFWFIIIFSIYNFLRVTLLLTFLGFPAAKSAIMMMYWQIDRYVDISLDHRDYKWYVRPIIWATFKWYRWTNKFWEGKK